MDSQLTVPSHQILGLGLEFVLLAMLQEVTILGVPNKDIGGIDLLRIDISWLVSDPITIGITQITRDLVNQLLPGMILQKPSRSAWTFCPEARCHNPTWAATLQRDAFLLAVFIFKWFLLNHRRYQVPGTCKKVYMEMKYPFWDHWSIFENMP